jgi:NDP-sugar pyrophosphorylase family protein
VAQYVVADESYWRDLGTLEKVMQAGRDLKQKVFLQ